MSSRYGVAVNVSMIGCSAPYREAVEQRLNGKSAAGDLIDAGLSIVLIHCDSAERWETLRNTVAQGSVCVAVLPELALEMYVKALTLGAAGVVQLDMSSAVTVDIIKSAAQGEVVVPRQVAHSLAMLAERRRPHTDLSSGEIEILRALSTGATVVDLAAQRFFSERTLRRQLQGIYLKLGARNRAEAIAAATRAGLLD